MSEKMTLEECLKCVHHASYREGAVMCRYWHREEQRMTQTIDKISFLINCPRTEGSRD